MSDVSANNPPPTTSSSPAVSAGPVGPAGPVAPEGSARPVPVSVHLFFGVCVLGVLAFVLWAALSPLDVVSVAMGEVQPSGRVKNVQHLEGGIVSDIRVREGQSVAQGDPLVVLESILSDATVDELAVRIAGLRLDIARLEAEATGAESVTFPPELVASYPELVDEQRELFAERQRRFSAQKSGAQQNVRQRSEDIREIAARLRSSRERLALVQEQVDISEKLLRDRLTTRYKHLQLLDELARLKSAIEEDQAALARARSALREAGDDADKAQAGFREGAREDLAEARGELGEFEKRMARYRDSQRRTTITSPVDGVVKSLAVTTEGGVIQPGGSVASIVPEGEQLVVEANLPIADVGYVREGQLAFVRLATRDAARFGRLAGTVMRVSPDTFSKDNQTFYRVRIETRADHFGSGAMRYELVPGMLVEAYIHIGQRTVLQYLLEPFYNAMGVVMVER